MKFQLFALGLLLVQGVVTGSPVLRSPTQIGDGDSENVIDASSKQQQQQVRSLQYVPYLPQHPGTMYNQDPYYPQGSNYVPTYQPSHLPTPRPTYKPTTRATPQPTPFPTVSIHFTAMKHWDLLLSELSICASF
jgi:hypothetical protein